MGTKCLLRYVNWIIVVFFFFFSILLLSLLQINLIQSLADIFMGTVQYNEEYLSIKQLCAIMTNKTRGDDTEGYSGLLRLVKVRGSSGSKSS